MSKIITNATQLHSYTATQMHRCTDAQICYNFYSLQLKYVSALLGIVLMLMLFTYNNNLYAGHMDCYEVPAGVTCGTWNSVTVTRSFPVFTACNITVTYAYRACVDINCPNKEIIQYALGDIHIPDNCTALMSQLFPGYPNNFGGVINQAYWNMLVDAIFYTLGKEYIIDNGIVLPPCTGANCDEAPSGPCDNYEVYYAQPECRAYCIKIGPVLPVGYRNTSVTQMSCDTETTYACCEYRKYFCMCGGELHVTNVATYTMGNCDMPPEQEILQQADCKSRTTDERDQLFYIPCSNNCSE